MNTQIDYAPTNPEPERPTLGDLLRAVEEFRLLTLQRSPEAARLGQRVADLAEDLEHMTGYVDGGEVYETAPPTAYDRALGDLYEIAQHDIRQGTTSAAVTVAVRNVAEASR